MFHPLEIKPCWCKVIHDPVILTTTLAIVLAVPRFVWILGGQYNLIILVFLIMWILPFVFLTKNGRKAIGICRPTNIQWLFYGFLLGAISSVIIYLIGIILYDRSADNWYVTIMATFDKGNLISQIKPHPGFFLLITFPAMLFSPIGEEFFFRGMLHESYRARLGNVKASVIDAAFFGFTHLAHHGLVYQSSNLKFHPSGIIWILLMMMVSILLSFVRIKNGSIWGAVVCHAGFNLGMMGSIVYLLHD